MAFVRVQMLYNFRYMRGQQSYWRALQIVTQRLYLLEFRDVFLLSSK
jgi:hypothetical protein